MPDHSSLTRIRERYGLEVFRRFFERIVEECFEAGLVWGKELFFDSTKVKANADIDILASRFLVETYLSGLFEGSSISEEGSEAEPPVGIELDTLPTSEDEALVAANSGKSDWISRAGKQDRTFSSGPRKRTADRLMSTTDPDATPMRLGSEGQTKLGYQTHYVVDGGKGRVILNVLVTPSEVTENRPMLDLLWRTAFRWRLWPDHVTGDAKYGTRQNVAALEKAGISVYVALPNFAFRDTGFFGAGHFRYDPEKDLYVCPADEHLHRHARTRGNRETRYRAKAEVCNGCELKKRCTNSEKWRTTYRRPDEDYYERVRAYRGFSRVEGPTKEEGVGRAFVR